MGAISNKKAWESTPLAKKIISAIFAGIYISLGATAYLYLEMVDNHILGSCFFALGIFLVSSFYNYLFTRVVPMSTATGDYKALDIGIAYVFNFVGAFTYAFLLSQTRLASTLSETIEHVGEAKMSDNFISLVIMGAFCAIMVGYGVLASVKYHDQKVVALIFYFILVAAFVLLGFDHIVANFFYYSFYSLMHGFDVQILPAVLAVTIGNLAGGLLLGFFYKYDITH